MGRVNWRFAGLTKWSQAKATTENAKKNGKVIHERKSKNGNYPPPPLRSLRVQRRNGNCDPQRAQNDIKSFF